MSSPRPKLSVGLPVYNGEKYLEQAIRAILGQTFEDFELVVSDNASSDRTEAICRQYADVDRRLRYYRNDRNLGATANYNRVFSLSQGRLFKWAAHDDLCLPFMFQRCVETMDEAPSSVVLVSPLAELIDGDGTVIGRSPDSMNTSAREPHRRLAKVLATLHQGHAMSGVARSEALRKAMPFGHIATDYVKLAELAMLGSIVEIPEVHLQLRLHSGNAMKLHPDRRSLLAWHDPNRGQRRLSIMPYEWEICMAYARSASRLPLSRRDRALCMGVAFAAPAWRWVLRRSGPARLRMQQLCGWSWLSGTGAESRRRRQ